MFPTPRPADKGVDGDPRRSRVRYFSAIAEVPFCGHATIALAVALSVRDGAGSFTFDTPVGPVVIETAGEGADITASFTAVEPQMAEFDDAVPAELLGLLGVGLGDLDPAYPPRIAYSGNWHPVLVFADRTHFDSFGFDLDAMRRLMDVQGWAATACSQWPFPLPAGQSSAARPSGSASTPDRVARPHDSGPLRQSRGRMSGGLSTVLVG